KWVQILSENKSNDDYNDNDIRNQFKESDLKRQENPVPTVPLLNLDTCPLASRLLPTIPSRSISHS
ncbi:2123_t:CDS:1, partial [Cetraspora pellucida]